ncbi:calcium ATPase transmembrane domain M-containing protein [Pluteus cervinus]|uniref:Calcium ATPase transmembrane domain M-containing protein n=1 Tax=Pluteus cervinus TaxID=181527 RepID=A0ACD3AK44_9AGAR|nr:calcium ATPase transmembrane domain M-containing protein [Pluteus cervinus]
MVVGSPSPNGDMEADQENLRLQLNYRTLSIHQTIHPENEVAPAKIADPANAIRQLDVHKISINDIFLRYSTSPTLGLETAALERLSKLGKNAIPPPPTAYYKKVLNYIFGGFNFLMWVAFIVTIISWRPLGGSDPPIFNFGVAMLLLLVIIVSATFYAVVDFHTSRIMNSIKSLISDDATVIRNGELQTIPVADIVVGDLVKLQIGQRVPADVRIVETSTDLRFDRSLLTGESDMVPGTIDLTSENVLETRNLAFKSTFVAQGSCTGVVFAIGPNTVMGRIVAMSGEHKFKLTTVQREVWFFTKIVSAVALSLFVLSIIIWAAWLRRSYPGFETASGAIINSLGCLTAFVPQGLPVCVALSLTIIAKRMAKRSILVKNLATIETLGCTSVLCSDKTGTLTIGQMTVQSYGFLDQQYDTKETSEKGPNLDALEPMHMIARLCNEAKYENRGESRTITGNATDAAILRFTESMSILPFSLSSDQLINAYDNTFEIPFNSRNKWMMTVIREKGRPDVDPWMLIKGAPDVLFPACTDALKSDGMAVPMDDDVRRQIRDLQDSWSRQGRRVLALCRKQLPALKMNHSNLSANDIEELMYDEVRDLTLVGLLGIHDPPRDNAKDTVDIIRRAGVRVFMVTGDFALTAVAIAKQVGIVTQERVETFADMRNADFGKEFTLLSKNLSDLTPSDDEPIRAIVLTGDDIIQFAPDDWNRLIGKYTEIVFSRTTPEQKLLIVEQIKARGDNTVAVTGDGVNDGPALKASDVGVAMGSGSDVAKEAAAIVLLNNDISSIPVAIEMGRLVFDNLKKVILYLMPAGTYSEFATVFANVFLGMQLALSSYLQVCFSITNDVVMSISLMYEGPESDLMLRKPRNARKDRLTDWRFFVQIYLFIGLTMWPCAMSMWFYYMSLQGLGFHDVILAYNKWEDGYKGFTIDQLTQFVAVGQCIYYITIVIMQYGGLLSVRNRRVSILHSSPLWGPRRNLVVVASMIGTVLIAVTNLYGPGLQKVFGTTPIPGKFWGLPFSFALGILLMDETRKLIVRTYPNSFVAKMAW